jgi:peptidoglycan/xylan/chitin deacetylase (PgdA/CDA1 family)
VNGLLFAGTALPVAAAYAASYFAEVRGIHDFLYPGALFRVASPHVVLTFDDGPDPEKTPRLLDALAGAGQKAVFFVIGERAERHPGLVRRIVSEGHQIGNHSHTHPYLPFVSTRRLERELDACQDVIAQVTGAAPRIARPPYGQKDYRYYRALAERGVTPVLWSKNLRDYYRTSPRTLLGRLSRAAAGDIVLCHDGDPLAPHTVDAVIAWLQTKPSLGLLPVPQAGVVG